MLDLADKAVETVKSAVSSEEPEAEEPAPEVEEEAEPEPETKEIVVRRQWGGLRDYRMALSSAGVFGTAGASSLSSARASSEQISPLAPMLLAAPDRPRGLPVPHPEPEPALLCCGKAVVVWVGLDCASPGDGPGRNAPSRFFAQGLV